MSTKSDFLFNPQTNQSEQTWKGFSWPTLCFGFFWFLHKKLYMQSLLVFVIIAATGGWAWFIIPFFSNKMHKDNLLKFGYVNKEDIKRCPECNELVNNQAKKCKHCGSSII